MGAFLFFIPAKPWLHKGLLTLVAFACLVPVINILDAFHIGSEPYLPPFERPVILSVALYSCVNFAYILWILYRFRDLIFWIKK